MVRAMRCVVRRKNAGEMSYYVVCGQEETGVLTWRLQWGPAFSYALLDIESMEGVGELVMCFKKKRAREWELIWILSLESNITAI